MKAFFLILLLFNFVFAVTDLKGDISGRTFNKKGNPYIVENELKIFGDKPTIIEPGCMFFFKPFTGIKISGSLIVKGTKKSPVTFTSIKNILFNEQDRQLKDNEVFDWNGIVIEEKAEEIEFKNFELSNSIFGLKSSTSNIVIHQGVFKNNGDFNFIIKNEVLSVKEGIPYDYGILSILKEEHKNKAKIIGISTLSISTAVFCSMGWSLYKANLYHNKYKESTHPIQMREFKHTQDLYLEEARNMGIIGAAFLSIGVGSLIYSRKNKDITEVSLFILPKNMFFCIHLDI